MAIEIRKIDTKGGLKKFVKWGIDLYKDNDCFVPPLVMDDVNTLDPKNNPAFDFCESIYFMAYDNGKPVGRIAGIINNVVNEKTGRTVRVDMDGGSLTIAWSTSDSPVLMTGGATRVFEGFIKA